MPDREASGPGSSPSLDATRLEAVERLRRQLADLEATGGCPTRSHPRPKRRRDSEGSSGLWRSDDGPPPSSSGEPDSARIEGARSLRGQGRSASDREEFDAHGPQGGGGSNRNRGRRSERRSRADTAEGGPAPGGGTEAQAKDVCLRLLTDRARSRAELADKLAAKGFTPEIIERTLTRLTEVGLIDDAAFAEQWVHSRHTYSGKGKKALAQELRRKGIAPEHAEPALSTVTPADEQSRATDLVRRKIQTLPRDLDRDKAIRRLVGMLARRGYNPSTAHSVVLAELTEAGFESTPAPPRPTENNPSVAPDDHDTAADLVRRKIRTLPRDLDRDKATRRLVGMLARRGFSQSVAYSVVREELAAASDI